MPAHGAVREIDYATRRPSSCSGACRDGAEVGSANPKNLLLTVGGVSGVLGIGGGVLLVPALIWLCRFEPLKAAGTSLAILIPPIGLPAAINS